MYTIFLFFYLNTGKQTVVFSQWVIRTELLNNTTIVYGTVWSELSWKGVHWRFMCAFVNFSIPEHENGQSNLFLLSPGFLFLNWTLNFLNRIEVNLLWNFNVNLHCGTVWLKNTLIVILLLKLTQICWFCNFFFSTYVIQCWLNCIWFSLFVTENHENNLNSVYINIL